MFPRAPLLLVLSFRFLISATPFQPTEEIASKLSAKPNIVRPKFPSNASIPPYDTPAENLYSIHCDGETYGYNPNIRDCEGAKESIIPDTKVWTLAERRPGLPPDTVPLPYRAMGDQALCYVQPVLIPGHTTAKGSLSMIHRAAAALILRCAASDTSQGGIATGIGGDNNLAVVLGMYQKPIACYRAFPLWQSCREILYAMRADKIPQIFGPRSDPAVTQALPFTINTQDLGCSANIFSAGKSDVASFYDIWEGVTAVFSTCTRQGWTGAVRGLGANGDIFITMTTNPSPKLPGNSSEVVVS